MEESWQMNYSAIWTPDGSHVLYQHRTLTVTEELSTTVGPSEIIAVDIASGQVRTLPGL